MEIVIAKNIGFCFGVTRAISTFLKEIDDNTYLLGELVHNKSVMSKIKCKIVQNIDDIPDKSKVIIGAHGVAKEVVKKAVQKKLEIVDLTCPKVAKVHKLVSERKNNLIVIIGKKNHPEVIGTIGYANEYIVIEDENDLEELSRILVDNKKKISIFSQTTISNLEFVSLVNKIKRMTRSYVEVIPCACPFSEERQKEVYSIATMCDLIIVVGGKNSSNTEKLYKIADSMKKTIWLEDENELNLEAIKDYQKIGIVSGTSTDIETINAIILKLKNSFNCL